MLTMFHSGTSIAVSKSSICFLKRMQLHMLLLQFVWAGLRYIGQFYAVYFTSRGDDFDANTAILGPAAVKQKILSLIAKGNEISTKEGDQLETLQVTYEMLLRGIELLPVDLYQSDATLYRLEGEKLRLPFTALKGLGGAAAAALAEAGKKGPYLSIDDITARSGVSKTVIDLLREHGSLTSLPESSQMSLFG